MNRIHLTTLPFLLALVATPAVAADDYDDMDTAPPKTRTEKKKTDEQVREIVKGFYAKTNIGGSVYLGNFRGLVKPGTSMALSVGQDFLDYEKMSMGWELSFFQGINNGVSYDMNPGPYYVQGDVRTYMIAGTIEWSTYISRRIGIGLRAGGGMLYSPLLMDEQYYAEEVLTTWGVEDPGYHGNPHPVVMGGPTFEYYTKMSHVSVGADIDLQYGIGFDLALSATGMLKYTF
jgi:hypothetical protein